MSKVNYGRILKVSPDKLFVPEAYQREQVRSHINAIKSKFEPTAARPPLIHKVGRGRYEIIDGQNTTQAWREIYGAETPIQCQVVETDKPWEVFIEVNKNVRPVAKADRVKAMHHGGEKVAVQLFKAIRSIGHELRFTSSGGALCHEFYKGSVWALYKFCERHGERTTRSMLAMLVDCFSRPDGEYIEADAKKAAFINALTIVYDNKYNDHEIYHGLSDWELSSADVLQKAKANGGRHGKDTPPEIAKVLMKRVASKNRK